MSNKQCLDLLAEEAFVAAHHKNLEGVERATVIAANSPFELIPEGAAPKKAVLLIHGLLESPLVMHDLAQFFYQQGFLTRVMRLPGHGTSPEDLLDVKYQDWLHACAQQIDALQARCEELYLVGYSTGAALALYHAAHTPKIKGVFLFAPALKIRTALSPLLYPLTWLGRLIPALRWARKVAETDFARYKSFPVNAGLQVHKLSKKVRCLLKRKPLTIPQFWVQSAADETVCVNTNLNYFHQTLQTENQFILYGNVVNLPRDARIIQRQSAYPEKNIVDFSHPCLGIDPKNTRYGSDANYMDVQHYKPKVLQLKSKQTLYAGALTSENLRQYYLTRLSYNPDFLSLTAAMQDFLAKINAQNEEA